MALQTKTFTWGSYAYQSESNAYVLELTLTENSTDQTNNRSNISYKLVLKSGSNNRFTGQIDSVIKLAGVQTASGSKQITAAYNSSWTLQEGTTNVTHNQDGSLNMPIEVSIDTYNSYAPPDKTLSWSWTLTTIPRASSITAAGSVTLGNACSVQWTPNSTVFRYKLKFSLGNWSYTTAVIHPNKTSAYTYAGYILPLEIARQITDSETGKMTVELITYSDSSGSNAIGTDSETFTVTVPENDTTKPTVEMTLAAVNDFGGLYLQRRTKLQGTLNALGMYGATIKSLTMKVDGKSYAAPWLSNVLNTPGQIPVVATAVDSRGFTGTAELTVEVLPYYRPRMTATACRCTADGTEADDGVFLKVRAAVDFAPADGMNSASLWYRYREENAQDYTEKVELFQLLVSGSTVETEPLLAGTFYKENAYSVQIVAVDRVGEETVVTVPIASEAVFRHKRAGGKGLGLGGYCDEDDLLDVHWNQRIRKDLQVDGAASFADGVSGNLAVGGALSATSYGGIYIHTIRMVGGNRIIVIKSRPDMGTTTRQSLFMFGNANGHLTCGLIALVGLNSGAWGGTGDVTIEGLGDGQFEIKIPGLGYDWFTLISAEYFEIIGQKAE